jgi:phage repressor protein C with HTH and peptisase S24 domain
MGIFRIERPKQRPGQSVEKANHSALRIEGGADPIGGSDVLQAAPWTSQAEGYNSYVWTIVSQPGKAETTGMPSAMLTHNQIWTALDRLAARAKLSPSGLAKRSGLDPTTFNKSKRITPEGRARWPSTESIAKALQATGVSVDSFVSLITDNASSTQSVPLIGFAEAGAGGYFDDGGFPVGKGWDEIAFPAVNDEHAYALEISGDSMLPAYRDGDVIIVSPAAPVRRGDRVVVKTRNDEVMVKELKRQTAESIELKSLNANHPERTLSLDDVVWMARIVWASQ